MDIKAEGLFITGTDTGVGKTVVAAAIARHLSLKGHSVGILKPVTSGALEKDGSLVSEDADLLRWASGCTAPDHITSPYVLREPIAPSEAALREGKEIRFELILEAYEKLASSHDIVIVEGAGGLLVPLAPGLLVADLPVRLDLPLLIVARPDLGTVNHTLMTCECALSRHIRPLGIVINGQFDNPAGAEEYAPRLISELSPVPLLGVLPRLESIDEKDLVEKLAPAFAPMHLETLLALEVDLG
jgi:dethiobiotin synthetase